MLDREQLETFATVVDVGTFDRAAAILNVTKGAVSQRVRALEETVANVLLLRERPVVPTAAGKVLLRHVKALRLLEEEALSGVLPSRSAVNPVSVAIAVDADSLATWLPRALWPMLHDRRMALEVVTDGQDDTLGRLASGEVIGCLTTEARAQPGFASKPLGALEYRCYAASPFVERYFPRGLVLHDVLAAPALLFRRRDTLHEAFLRSLFGFTIERYPRHVLPAPAALFEGVREGIGYGLLPSCGIQAMAQRSALVDLAPERPVRVDLYWHHWLVEPAMSQVITRRIMQEAERSLIAR